MREMSSEAYTPLTTKMSLNSIAHLLQTKLTQRSKEEDLDNWENSNLKDYQAPPDYLSPYSGVKKYDEVNSKSKKPVRKQTSFAVTDARSRNESLDEIPFQAFAEPLEAPFVDPHPIGTVSDRSGQVSQPGVRSPREEGDSSSSNMTTDQEFHRKVVQPASDAKMVGLLTAKERARKVKRYLEKKRRRKLGHTVRYESRKDLAHERFRFEGRFIRYEDLHKFQGNYLIDYKEKKLVKPVFKIVKIRAKAS